MAGSSTLSGRLSAGTSAVSSFSGRSPVDVLAVSSRRLIAFPERFSDKLSKRVAAASLSGTSAGVVRRFVRFSATCSKEVLAKEVLAAANEGEF